MQRLKADSHIPCRSHAVPLSIPCHSPTVLCPSWKFLILWMKFSCCLLPAIVFYYIVMIFVLQALMSLYSTKLICFSSKTNVALFHTCHLHLGLVFQIRIIEVHPVVYWWRFDITYKLPCNTTLIEYILKKIYTLAKMFRLITDPLLMT
jgi:hypothetical protein